MNWTASTKPTHSNATNTGEERFLQVKLRDFLVLIFLQPHFRQVMQTTKDPIAALNKIASTSVEMGFLLLICENAKVLIWQFIIFVTFCSDPC